MDCITPRRRWDLLLAMGAICLIWAARLAVIHGFGLNVPYLDQWTVEPPLYLQWQQGRIDWAALPAAHNEHRILTTRLWLLMLYALNGAWEPRLQMAANALVAAAAWATLAWTLSGGLCPRRRYLTWFAAVLLGSIPFAWVNLLGGFQVQFHFVMLLSTLVLRQAILPTALVGAWWWSVPGLLLAIWSLGSGALSGLAAAAVLLGQAAVRRQQIGRLGAAAALLGAIAILAILSTPHRVSMQQLDLAAAMRTFLKSLAWPLVMLPAALVVHLPLVRLLWQLRRPRTGRAATPQDWLLAGLGLLTVLLAMSIAVARDAGGAGPMRHYLDTLAPGLLVNFVILLRMPMHDLAGTRSLAVVRAASFAWIALIVLGLAAATPALARGLDYRRTQTTLMQQNLRGYLRSGDERYLREHGPVPLFTDVTQMKSLADDPRVVALLPADLSPSLPHMALHESPGAAAPTRLAYLYRFEPQHTRQIAVQAFTSQKRGVRLQLRWAGGSHQIIPGARDSWQGQRYLRIPADEFELIAERDSDVPASALQFTHPQAVGRLTWCSEWLLSHAQAPAALGLLAWVALAIFGPPADRKNS